MEQAVDWYHERLLSAPDAAVARKYLRERGLTATRCAPSASGGRPTSGTSWCKALQAARRRHRDTGLGFLNRNDRQTDAFRGRVLFPIFDANGDAVGFGGRVMPGAEGPKYKNTPETALYQKSKLLYALNWSKARIVNDDRAIVCEGYTDVIGFARAGLPPAVATCGTALTKEHVKLLRRFARKLVLAFDADAAGQAAAERFYQWEKEHELEVAVADLPAGRRSRPTWPAPIPSASPPRSRRRCRSSSSGSTACSPAPTSAPSRAGPGPPRRAVDVIREHPSELVRDQYVMEVAGVTRVVARAAPRDAAPAARSRAIASAVAREPPARGPVVRPPRRRGARRSRARGAAPRRARLGAVEPWIRYEELFRSDLHAATFRVLMAHPTVQEAIDAADPGVAELIGRLATEELRPSAVRRRRPPAHRVGPPARWPSSRSRHRVDDDRSRCSSRSPG